MVSWELVESEFQVYRYDENFLNFFLVPHALN